MSVKLIPPSYDTIPMSQMHSGQLAAIIDDPYDGTVVQMLRAQYSLDTDMVISVGRPLGRSWSAPFGNLRVRPLKDGEQLKVCDNGVVFC